MKKISIIVPCYNETDGILLFFEKMQALLQTLPTYQFEMIFVDDGSMDNTSGLLNSLCQLHDWIKVVSLTRNFGKEAAMTAGLDLATGDALVFMDADLQHPPDTIPDFISHWEQGALVVVGKRTSRNADSKLYKLLAQSFYCFHDKISHITLPVNVGDFRLIDQKVAGQLKQLKESQRFMKGLFAWVGYEPVYVDYTVAARLHGSSSFNKWRSWNFALEGITSFSTVPLRIWTYVGAFVLLIGLIYAFLILIDALVHGIATPGYVTLLTAVIVFGGIQLMGIGILGEYIGRIYMEVKARPTYLIDKIITKSAQND
jgi:glycosyltransferase involved in cell wall biosynthesis